MTLLYKDKDGNIATLEEVVKKHPTIWKNAIKYELNFCNQYDQRCSLFDLIIEASEILDEKIRDYTFFQDTTDNFDFEILILKYIK